MKSAYQNGCNKALADIQNKAAEAGVKIENAIPQLSDENLKSAKPDQIVAWYKSGRVSKDRAFGSLVMDHGTTGAKADSLLN